MHWLLLPFELSFILWVDEFSFSAMLHRFSLVHLSNPSLIFVEMQKLNVIHFNDVTLQFFVSSEIRKTNWILCSLFAYVSINEIIQYTTASIWTLCLWTNSALNRNSISSIRRNFSTEIQFPFYFRIHKIKSHHHAVKGIYGKYVDITIIIAGVVGVDR